MKLGYLTPLTVETIQNARRLGYDALEASGGWMEQHLLDDLERNLPTLQAALGESEMTVTALTLYCNPLRMPVGEAVAHYQRAFRLARSLGSNVVASFTGRDNALTIDGNLPLFAERFRPITQAAEDQGVRIAFEPWPGQVTGHGPYQWANLATTPQLWDRVFEATPSPALGLEYDASHLLWQGIDYLQAVRNYAERIYHVHAKDIVVDKAVLKRVGVHGDGWWRFVIPGLGVIDWPELFGVLAAAGYRGDIAVEHEDRTYLNERWNEGLSLGLKTLRPLVDAYPA
jgi:sugar phosphate isomerase/epimerase